MQLKQIINSKPALEKLLQNSLPISISWSLMKFVKAVTPELETFEALKDQKIRELGEEVKSETGEPTGNITVKEENMPEFLKLMNELLVKEIEVKVPEIKIDSLIEHKGSNGSVIEITTNDLLLLDWLIVE